MTSFSYASLQKLSSHTCFCAVDSLTLSQHRYFSEAVEERAPTPMECVLLHFGQLSVNDDDDDDDCGDCGCIGDDSV